MADERVLPFDRLLSVAAPALLPDEPAAHKGLAGRLGCRLRWALTETLLPTSDEVDAIDLLLLGESPESLPESSPLTLSADCLTPLAPPLVCALLSLCLLPACGELEVLDAARLAAACVTLLVGADVECGRPLRELVELTELTERVGSPRSPSRIACELDVCIELIDDVVESAGDGSDGGW